MRIDQKAVIEMQKVVFAQLGKNDWVKVSQMIFEKYNVRKTSEACRGLFRRHKDVIEVEEIVVPNLEQNQELIKQLQKGADIDHLIKVLKMSRIEVFGHIEELRQKGYAIVQIGKIYKINKQAETTFEEHKHYHDVDQIIRFGVVSDTHTASIFFQKSYLEIAYDDFKSRGIETVYHIGDVSDGHYVNRPASIYELYAIGYDQQLDDVVDNYPSREGIKTKFITGNHDATHMMNGGANIGKGIDGRRDDMDYLGHEFAKIWLTDKVDMDLIHPRDGSAYALSYHLQRRINNMSGGNKPKILITGHYHKFFMMFYRNVVAISMPSFQSQSSFMRGKGLDSDVGYMILELKVNKNGDIIECHPFYRPFFVMRQDFRK